MTSPMQPESDQPTGARVVKLCACGAVATRWCRVLYCLRDFCPSCMIDHYHIELERPQW
jgi:hypothetical protein